ncbi:MAG: hypothetical protein AABX93_03310 [Nanoarchaeota archaeon]
MKVLMPIPNENSFELLKIEKNNWQVNSEDMQNFVKNLYGKIEIILKEAKGQNYAGVSNLFSVLVSDSGKRIGYSKGFGVLDEQGINITQVCLEQHLDILSGEKIYPCTLDFYLSLNGYKKIDTQTAELPSPFLN